MAKIGDLLLRSMSSHATAPSTRSLSQTTGNASQTPTCLSACDLSVLDVLGRDQMRTLCVRAGLSHLLRSDDTKSKMRAAIERLVLLGNMTVEQVLKLATERTSTVSSALPTPLASTQGMHVHGQAGSQAQHSDWAGMLHRGGEHTGSQAHAHEVMPCDEDDMLLLDDVPYHDAMPPAPSTGSAPCSTARSLPAQVITRDFLPAPAFDGQAHYQDSDVEVDLSSDSECSEREDGQDRCVAQTVPRVTRGRAQGAVSQIVAAKAALQVLPKAVHPAQTGKRRGRLSSKPCSQPSSSAAGAGRESRSNSPAQEGGQGEGEGGYTGLNGKAWAMPAGKRSRVFAPTTPRHAGMGSSHVPHSLPTGPYPYPYAFLVGDLATVGDDPRPVAILARTTSASASPVYRVTCPVRVLPLGSSWGSASHGTGTGPGTGGGQGVRYWGSFHGLLWVCEPEGAQEGREVRESDLARWISTGALLQPPQGQPEVEVGREGDAPTAMPSSPVLGRMGRSHTSVHRREQLPAGELGEEQLGAGTGGHVGACTGSSQGTLPPEEEEQDE